MKSALSDDDIRDRYRRLQAKVREYRQEAARCREIARRMAEARGTRAVLCGVYPDRNDPGNILAFACAPNLDEENLGEALRIMMREFWDGAARNSDGKIPMADDAGLRHGEPRVTGTMSEDDDDPARTEPGKDNASDSARATDGNNEGQR